MTFQAAKAKLLEIAAGRYCSIAYSETIYDSNGSGKQECKLYLEGLSWTSSRNYTWEMAFAELENPIVVDDAIAPDAPEDTK